MVAPAAIDQLTSQAVAPRPAATPTRSAAATPEPLPSGLLADIAAGIAQVPEAWQELVCHDPERRHPVRLIATDAYEVWVIGWMKGQGVRPHDHDGSAAVVLVTEGELTEVTLLGQQRRLVPGQIHHVAPGVVHDVLNRRDQPATSIHIYSPPLSRMTYYDPETWEPEETVPIEPETPVLSGPAGSHLLHPARGRR
jgi:quercetin dioxygenase-like cupin family protein